MTRICRAPLDIPAAWKAADLARSTRWTSRFDDADIAELEVALAHVKARKLTIATMTRDEFPLPTVAAKLAAMLDEIENGTGVMLVRGLPVARWGLADV